MPPLRKLSILAIAHLALLAGASPLAAQSATNPDTGVTGHCINCGTSDTTTSTPFGLGPGWLGNLFRGDGGAGRRARATQINNEGVAAYNAGNFQEALRLYREAAQLNPDNAVIRDNLAQAQVRVDEQAREGARAQQNQRQLADASGRIADIAADVARSLASSGSGAATSGLAFGSSDVVAAPAAQSAIAGQGPRLVVPTILMAADGRPLAGLPRLELMENSPGREAWLRGMDAVAQAISGHPGEWQLALAWFQTAQLRDPTNPALARAVILAQWTMARRAEAAAAEAAASAEVESGFMFLYDRALAEHEAQLRRHPSAQPPASDAEPDPQFMAIYNRTTAEAAGLPTRSAPQPLNEALLAPRDEDLELLFDPDNSSAARAVAEHRSLEAGLNAMAEDIPLPRNSPAEAMYNRRMAGVHNAFPDPAAGIISPEANARIEAERRRAARGLDEDARLLFGRGDLAGAAALEHQAHLQQPANEEYRIVRETMRQILAGNRGYSDPNPAVTAEARGH